MEKVRNSDRQCRCVRSRVRGVLRTVGAERAKLPCLSLQTARGPALLTDKGGSCFCRAAQSLGAFIVRRHCLDSQDTQLFLDADNLGCRAGSSPLRQSIEDDLLPARRHVHIELWVKQLRVLPAPCFDSFRTSFRDVVCHLRLLAPVQCTLLDRHYRERMDEV